ncbi:response regulator [Diplocloster hominis]|uniref:response regulator n=1 Tax=Diplocloster hominis TaxID=3079010 RepID=UPI0031BA813A
MKVLIVDDEALTREGLISSVDWASLNITEIFQADDGIHGLELAGTEKPEIILSDVRMPRMDGIQMAEKLRKILPNTSIIFMSGYSDKEYLKAAIKLKAIRYVEKPIDPQEVLDAVTEAIENNELLKRSRRSQLLQHREKSTQLALAITHSRGKEVPDLSSMLGSLQLNIHPETCFSTIIVQTMQLISELEPKLLETLYDSFNRNAHTYQLDTLYAAKHERFLIFHLFGDEMPKAALYQQLIQNLADSFQPLCNFFLAVGKPVVGISNVHHSYNDAVILLQSGFFYGYNCILTAKRQTEISLDLLKEQCTIFEEALSSRAEEQALQALSSLNDILRNRQTLLANQIKDIYYRLLILVQNSYSKYQLNSPQESSDMDSIWGDLAKCNTLDELTALLSGKVFQLFEALREQAAENSTIYLIKEYISKNYDLSSLSVKDISEHVYLTSTYVCTLFKAETGQTLNQYLTEFRMERAKQLLEDPRNKIADISSRVGYTDGNYFGKSFKKIVGLSPSEYREKMLG